MTHGDAAAYCAWRNKRLPSWHEWEIAARGPASSPYPWGDEAPSCDRAHQEDCGVDGPVAGGTASAGATPCGVLDMAGNVAEFTEPGGDMVDGDSARFYERGGSYRTSAVALEAYAVTGDEQLPYTGWPWVGFRCAHSLP